MGHTAIYRYFLRRYDVQLNKGYLLCYLTLGENIIRTVVLLNNEVVVKAAWGYWDVKTIKAECIEEGARKLDAEIKRMNKLIDESN